MTRLAIQPGDTLQIGGPDENLMTVVKRLRRGYLVRPHGADATTVVDDLDVATAYNDRLLRHWACDVDGLDERTAAKLRSAFDAWPPHCQRECLRKLVFVQAVDRARDAHRDVLATAKTVVPDVWSEWSERWRQEERDAAVVAAQGRRRRDAVEQDGDPVVAKAVDCPEPSTVRTWHTAWTQAGRDEMALMPDLPSRGNRNPRYPVAKSDDEQDTYKMMEEAAKGAYLDLLARSKQIVYELYQKLCRRHSLPEVSGRTFRRFLKKRFDDYERVAARKGKKEAFLAFGIFALRDLPDRPLEEVEVDHCLVDLIVVDNEGRPIGRPWITVLLDRATKCIVGLHVSFMPPSYLTIQRALAHALYEKDLSAFPGLKHGWPCFGLVEWLISDRGKEFLSRSFRTACLLLHVYAVALPGRKPWLKGAVERIFRTLHVRVFDLREGSTKAWNPDTYNAAKRATVKRCEFDRMLVEWVVDDYHEAPHPALKRKYGREMAPSEAWAMLTDRWGVRFAPNPHDAFRLTGEIFERKILSTGIHIKNLVYLDKALLERLLRKPGGRERTWTFRRDRADLGRIWVLVEDEGWHEIPNVDLDLFDGASEQQFALWRSEAADMCGDDEPTIADLREARRRVEETRANALEGRIGLATALRHARYGDIGATFTPVPGFHGAVPALTVATPPLALPAPSGSSGGDGKGDHDDHVEHGDRDRDEDLEADALQPADDAGRDDRVLADEIDAEVRRMLEEMGR